MIKRTLCIESPCHLKCSNEQLVVCYSHVKGLEDRADRTLPIEDIGMLVLEHQQITITHFVQNKLVANHVAKITCNETHHSSGLFMSLESSILQSERFRHQIEITVEYKKN